MTQLKNAYEKVVTAVDVFRADAEEVLAEESEAYATGEGDAKSLQDAERCVKVAKAAAAALADAKLARL